MTRHARWAFMIVLGIFIPSLHSAPVPVVDASANNSQNRPNSHSAPTTTRVASASSDSPASLLYQLELLQQEVQALRGLVEEQAYQMNQMRAEQRDRYLDLDRRISLLSNANKSPERRPKIPHLSTDDSPVQPPSAGLDEKEEYQAAFELIRSKKYDDAIAAFEQFVKVFPVGNYTGNAYYWLGEVQVVKANLQAALTAFDALMSKFPEHRKIPDAKYKLGKVYRELGNSDKAKQVLQEVVSQHSGTSAAKLAEAELRNFSP